METQELKELAVEICSKVITTLSEKHTIKELRIRIDLEHAKATPVFGLFDKSTFRGRCALKEIINAGGGQGMGMILSAFIKKMLKDIFFQTMTRLAFNDPKQMFVLLYIKSTDSVTIPTISIYKDGVCLESMPIADVIVASSNPL